MTVSHTLGIAVLALIVVTASAALPPETSTRWAPLVSALIVLATGGWLVGGQVRATLGRRDATVDGHAEPHEHEHPHSAADAHAHPHPRPHAPEPGAPITWRSLAVLGVAGGIVPSTNALLLLLAAIATGRPAWGLVLVVAFGVGMAFVLAGIGVVLVHARRLAEHGAFVPGLARAARLGPTIGAVAVLAVGAVLTVQAVEGSVLF